jgi:hypothetical protein
MTRDPAQIHQLTALGRRDFQHGADLLEDRADARCDARHNGASSYGDKASHQGVFWPISRESHSSAYCDRAGYPFHKLKLIIGECRPHRSH